MAILKGIEASVIIDGKALTEYDDEDTIDESSDHTSEVSKYIEAVSDAEFSISMTVPKSYKFGANAISFKLSIDGAWLRTYICRKAKLKDLGEDWHMTIAGSKVKNGEEWYLRPFRFDDIKIVEASTSTAGSGKTNSVANLGIVVLDVFDEEVTRRIYSADMSAVRLGQSSEIAEKELKGRNVSLQTTFGESRPSTEPNYYHSKSLSTKPVLSFRFNYRSRKALQGQHLIPRTPSPSPLPTPVPLEERPFDSLTPEELQELGRRFHAKCQTERDANIKPENIKPEDIKPGMIKPEKIKLERGIKRENDQEYEDMIKLSIAKRAKTRPFGQSETIELD